jgi:hypothetical protein
MNNQEWNCATPSTFLVPGRIDSYDAHSLIHFFIKQEGHED